jgi:hypothetical protein
MRHFFSLLRPLFHKGAREKKLVKVTYICHSPQKKVVPYFKKKNRVFGRFVTRGVQKHDLLFNKNPSGIWAHHTSQKMFFFPLPPPPPPPQRPPLLFGCAFGQSQCCISHWLHLGRATEMLHRGPPEIGDVKLGTWDLLCF